MKAKLKRRLFVKITAVLRDKNYQLSIINYQLSIINYQLSIINYQLSIINYQLSILLTIFFGGGLGSVTRFALAKWVNVLHSHHFPYGTLTVNIVACLVLGLVVGLADHRQMLSPTARMFWAVGFCGGFSTFSTFSNETLGLLQQGYIASGFLYMLLSVVFCLLATFSGLLLAGKL